MRVQRGISNVLFWAGVAGASLAWRDASAADGLGRPLVFERQLRWMASDTVQPLFGDDDGDGIEDLMVRASPELHVVSAIDGSLLRAYSGEPGGRSSFPGSMESFADVDGDGLREIAVGDHLKEIAGVTAAGVVYGVLSDGPEGPMASAHLGFRFEGAPGTTTVGTHLGATDELVLVASGSNRVLVVEVSSGEIVARLETESSAVAGVGDIDGDGVEDFAANTRVFSGTVRTAGDGFQTPDALSPGELLVTLSSTPELTPGVHGGRGDRELIVNLGDPLPQNGVREHLIVAGVPVANGDAGGLTAHVLTVGGDGSVVASEVVAHLGQIPDEELGFDLARLPDVDGDGVRDLAVLAREFAVSGEVVGRILCLSGAALLDGLSLDEDLLQELRGVSGGAIRSMRSLGDYDDDVVEELLVTLDDSRRGSSSIVVYSVVPLDAPPDGIPRPGDCDGNGVLDECDIASGVALDCNGNGQPDRCDLAAGLSIDCNDNSVPDECEIVSGDAQDEDGDGVPDECDPVRFVRGDANRDGVATLADAYRLEWGQRVERVSENPLVVSCEDAWDADDNGVLDSADVERVLAGLIGSEPPLLPPHPVPGLDRTLDGLGCRRSGDREALDDPVAVLRVLDVEAPGGDDGFVRLRFAMSNSARVAGIFGALRLEPHFLNGGRTGSMGTVADSAHDFHRGVYQQADGVLRFYYLCQAVESPQQWLPPGDDVPVLEMRVCLEEGTPAGSYAIRFEGGELVEFETGRAILPILVDGTLTLLADVTEEEFCQDRPPPQYSPLNVSFELGSTRAGPGEEFTVPFIITADARLAGYTASIDFDEGVVEALGIERVFGQPDPVESYSFWRGEFDNGNAVPGNGGVDEGFFVTAGVLWTVRSVYLPAATPTEISNLRLRVRPDADVPSTALRFENGGMVGGDEPIANSVLDEDGNLRDAQILDSLTLVDAAVQLGEAAFVRGDSNGDGSFDISDALATLGFLFLGSAPLDCVDAADTNGDGSVDVSDPSFGLGFLFLGGPAPPPPHPQCGAGAGDSSLSCDDFAPCVGAP